MENGLVEEVLFSVGSKIGLSRCLATKRLAVTHFLQIVQAAGDALVARAVEGIRGM